MKSTSLTIFVTPLKGEEIQIEKVCTLNQAVTLAKKEARKMLNNGGMWVTINIMTRMSYGVETLAHIEGEKEGRRAVFTDEQPAETYAVCWGESYKEEDGEDNAIATTADESKAKEIAENESVSNNCVMSVVRKSGRKSIAIYNNTPATETAATEFSELSPAGYCLDVYLNNTREIYDRYTAPAIGQAVDCIKDNARCMSRPDFYEVIAAMTTTFGAVESAVYEAGRLVERYDRMKPKTKDIEQVTRNYAAYIVDCAKYEIETINA